LTERGGGWEEKLCVSVKKTGAREGCEDYTVVLKEILNYITISITILFSQ